MPLTTAPRATVLPARTRRAFEVDTYVTLQVTRVRLLLSVHFTLGARPRGPLAPVAPCGAPGTCRSCRSRRTRGTGRSAGTRRSGGTCRTGRAVGRGRNRRVDLAEVVDLEQQQLPVLDELGIGVGLVDLRIEQEAAVTEVSLPSMMPLDSSSIVSGAWPLATGVRNSAGSNCATHAPAARGDLVGHDARERRVVARILLDQEVAVRVDRHVVGLVEVRRLVPSSSSVSVPPSSGCSMSL